MGWHLAEILQGELPPDILGCKRGRGQSEKTLAFAGKLCPIFLRYPAWHEEIKQRILSCNILKYNDK
jgi:hypothetical protein